MEGEEAKEPQNGGVWSLNGDDLSLLAASSGETKAVIVPSEQVLISVVHLPLKALRERVTALPFALEDQVAEPLGSLHFALGTEVSEYRHICGAVRHSVMAAWVEKLEANGLLDAFVVPDALVLPMPKEGGWSVQRSDERTLVRTSDGAGFACQISMLPALWEAAGSPLCISYGEPLPPEIPSEPAEVELEPITSRIVVPDLDLRQGLYARPRPRVSKVTRRVSYVLAAGALAHAGIAIADTIALKSIAADRREAAQELVEKYVPGTVASEEFAVEVQQLLETSRGLDRTPFIPLMNQLATTLGRAGPGVTLRTLSYDGANGTLRLVVEAPDMNSLQRVQPALTAGGLEVLTDAATFDPTSNIAGFRIETGEAGAIR